MGPFFVVFGKSREQIDASDWQFGTSLQPIA